MQAVTAWRTMLRPSPLLPYPEPTQRGLAALSATWQTARSVDSTEAEVGADLQLRLQAGRDRNHDEEHQRHEPLVTDQMREFAAPMLIGVLRVVGVKVRYSDWWRAVRWS